MKNVFMLSMMMIAVSAGNSQFILDNDQALEWYIENVLLGGGVTVDNATFNNVSDSIVNEQFGSFDATAVSNFPVSEGIILSTGNIENCQGPNDNGAESTSVPNGISSEVDLESLLMGVNVYDVAILEFDFIPANNLMLFDFAFASEEYPEFAGSSFNDVFGFFISGPGINGTFSNNAMNVAMVPMTTDAVSINNVNATTNSTYYIDNTNAPSGDSTYTQFDGYTVSIPVSFTVVPNSVYHIKMTVADASDSVWDSAVFIKANSFKSIAQPVTVRDIENIEVTLGPVPVEDILYINIEVPSLVMNAITFYDLSGRLVLTRSNFELMDRSIDISDLMNGTYIAEIRTNFGVFTERIIKE